MLNQKMNNLIKNVCDKLAEREELIHTIALAILTKKNLFILGEPGQAKSQAIDLFRSYFPDMQQFEILMSKETTQEQLFGRLDLASIIPGHISHSILEQDNTYQEMAEEMKENLAAAARMTEDNGALIEARNLQIKMETYRKCLAELYGGVPEILTQNKIPESHICFLDEIFKSNDGVLNSLLKALNERTYTNEGISVRIPVISFFSASNEIPNFNNPEEKSLRALYDRFDFKVCTHYVEEKANRMKVLAQKRDPNNKPSEADYIGLQELYQMQEEIRRVVIPNSIDELADSILCELRRKDIFVTDRTYFNFGSIVQAEAWLNGRDTVQPQDMMALVNYLWDKPEQKSVIEETIIRLTQNPLGDKLDELLARAYQCQQDFNSASDKNMALRYLRTGLLSLYTEAEGLKSGLSENDAAHSAVDGMISTLENISREAHAKTTFTYLSLSELKAYEALSA